ncbi:MAG TPA: tRNA-dihydrouridine synthase family protein [Smithellaceae bacterium]|nr:tRNA-dihydrouridine synthase family protein [Smithellaceae bacterium]
MTKIPESGKSHPWNTDFDEQRIPKLPIVYLAPLQGMTDRIYRNLFPLYFKGVDLAVAPFLSATKSIKPGSLLRDHSPDQNSGIPTIPQIMSSAPDDFTRLANALFDIGYGEVNWNLGCPFRMVVKKGRGAGMLCRPDRIEAFLEKAVPALKPKLSIKLRLGLKDPDEILELIPVFNRFPLEELIIHPRTGAQMYGGNVDLDRFGKCLDLSQHRVVYNGDVTTVETYERIAGRFGSVHRWMIGRGLLGNPFLAEEIKFQAARPYDEKVGILRAFHDHLFSEYSKILSGPAHLTNKMKEFWTYSGSFLRDREKNRKSINKTHHRDQYLAAVRDIFDDAL